MLSLWKLTLLCGLFISPSCCLLDSLSPVLGNVQSTLNKETQLVSDATQALAQDLKEELAKVNLSPVGKLLDNTLGDVGNLVGTTLNTVVSKLEKLLAIKVLDSEVLKIKAELNSDGQSINLRVPVSVTVGLKLSPLVSDLTKVKVGLDILLRANIGTDATTDLSVVVLGDCSSDSSTVSISLLNGLLGLEKLVWRGVDGLLKKLLPIVVETQVCPLVKNVASLLDVSVIQELTSQLQTQASVDIPLKSLL
ncbi:BPI fold-containing family A member 2 [Trichosurus vulpecula]|uniref:BPI fold-containing family A member 2 n=1 Tax=Trichosurus vulpecula TaxID=9337 RepID=UPI00186AD342|nr:BPI fold-containing family A member 2 [Trichosurus vulpecula]